MVLDYLTLNHFTLVCLQWSKQIYFFLTLQSEDWFIQLRFTLGKRKKKQIKPYLISDSSENLEDETYSFLVPEESKNTSNNILFFLGNTHTTYLEMF